MDPACIFCRVSSGQAEASLVYQDGSVTAFMDILPVNPGHLLVVPNQHTPDLASLDEGTGGRMFTVAVRMSQALRGADVACEGVNLYLADGRAAGQEVLHVHLHVLPRFAGDGFGLRRAKQLHRSSREELDTVAARIRSALAA